MRSTIRYHRDDTHRYNLCQRSLVGVGGRCQEWQRRSPRGNACHLHLSGGVDDSRQDTHVQEPVKGLSDAAIGVHDITHVFQDSFLGGIIFENDSVTCTG